MSMSDLTVYAESRPSTPIVDTGDASRIARELGEAGIRFERWEAAHDLPHDADNDTIIEAYRPEIDRLVTERGYQTFDVVE
jgi:1,2-dihydroxy-3-keto-5-methylthiopentene dioxygenase